MSLTPETIRWFKDRRGLDQATLEAFGIESEGEGVSIPYPEGVVKHRKTLEKVDGRHVMYFDPKPPQGQEPFLSPGFQGGTHVIVFEGETDTMAAWQAAPSGAKSQIMGVSGSNALGPNGMTDARVQELFGDAVAVFFVFDNEDPYTQADKSVETGKKQIKERLGKKAKFVRLPIGPQDACEFFQSYDWAAFRELLVEANKVTYNFKALDLTTDDIPEYDWLVDNFLVKGDIGLLVGDGGTGKSELLLDLAIHMARGDDEWLGMKLDGRRVMVIDQENPEVTVRRRLYQHGFRKEHAENMRYVWYQHVLLDNPEQVLKMYEDVANFEPDLLVLDSLSRMHLRNENANEEMNPLINGAIFPLARQMGVTVVMIHHVAKGGGSRGATAIRNAVDICLDMTKSEDEVWRIVKPDKLRNVAPWGAALWTRLVEDDEGNVNIATEEDMVIV